MSTTNNASNQSEGSNIKNTKCLLGTQGCIVDHAPLRQKECKVVNMKVFQQWDSLENSYGDPTPTIQAQKEVDEVGDYGIFQPDE